MSTGVCAVELETRAEGGEPKPVAMTVIFTRPLSAGSTTAPKMMLASSSASSIVQEAADEDANIIFGAVVDPALNGRVKITVIATGFGSPPSARVSSSTAQTPVDMTPYSEASRMRIDGPPPGNGGASSMQGGMLPLPNVRHGDDLLEAPEADTNSAFDVPAFLRRQ